MAQFRCVFNRTSLPTPHSEELQDALGVTEKTLPPFIYRMRQLGYPPGWLKEAEMEKSGLTLYDGKGKRGEDSVCLYKPAFWELAQHLKGA